MRRQKHTAAKLHHHPAVDQKDGKTLWQFPTNIRMKASPMTFTVGGKQYVAVAAGPNILCFGL